MRRIIGVGIALLAAIALSSLILAADETLFTNKAQPRINVTFSEPVTVLFVTIDDNPSITVDIVENRGDMYYVFSPSTTLSEGPHNFSVTVRDSIGNQGVFGKGFVIDLITPLFQGLYPDDGAAIFTKTPTFNFSASEELGAHYYEIGRKSYTFTTKNNKVFTKKFSFSADDEYVAYIFISDPAGNSREKTLGFTLVTEDLTIDIVNPPFGIANSPSFRLQLRTNRRATCNWSLQGFSQALTPFSYDTTLHAIDFVLQGKTTFYASCVDNYGYSGQEKFTLKVDDVVPTIQATVNPEIITQKTGGIDLVPVYATSLTAKSTERNSDGSPDPVVCKYSLTTNVYEDMVPFHDYDESLYTAYELVKIQNITHLENNRIYTCYVACKDLAGNIGMDVVRIEVAEPSGPTVTINYPRDAGYISETKPKLNVTTNMAVLSCRYSTSQTMTGSTTFSGGGYQHISPALTGLTNGGSYTYYVGCTFSVPQTVEVVEKTSFSIDTTAPTMRSVLLYDPAAGRPGVTFRLDRLHGNWSAVDDESGIEHYSVEVYHKKSTGDVLLKTVQYTQKETDITGLTLTDGETYYIKVRAMNKAGAWSQAKNSNNILVDKDIKIDLDDVCNNGYAGPDEACDGSDLRGLTCTNFDEFTGGSLSCTSSCEYSTQYCLTCDRDNKAESGEVCDGTDLRGKTCKDFGFTHGTLSCSSTCEFDTSQCTILACDNDAKREFGESCDCGGKTCTSAMLDGKTCQDFGFAGGSLRCSGSCDFDTSFCTTCDNDGKAEAGEACDGNDVRGVTCSDFGYLEGNVYCTAQCALDFSRCPGKNCDNDGIAEVGEACDKTDFRGKTCDDFGGFTGGTLSCNSACEFDTQGCSYCDNNNNAQSSEACDGTDLKQKSCTDFDNFESGALSCVDCDYVTTQCKVGSCNNDGTQQTGEVCDCGGKKCTSTQLAGKTCVDFDAFTGGALGCSSTCMYDFDGCVTCNNNGKAEKGEPCDGKDLNGKTCASLGFQGGVLSCSGCEFVTSKCYGGSETPAVCSNGVAETDEACDGSDLRGLTCLHFDEFTGGSLGCSSACEYSTQYCLTCNRNNKAEAGEACDGSDLRSKTCKDFGFTHGTLTCSSSCEYDTSQCTILACDRDGKREFGESCDCGSGTCSSAQLDGKTCEDFGFNGGSLKCTNSCDFDTSYCTNCDNDGKAEAGEACDGNDVRGLVCTDFPGYLDGQIFCTTQCTLDYSRCSGKNCDRDGTAELGEACDGSDLRGKACADFGGFTGGTLGCNEACEYDTQGCAYCDHNNDAAVGEACDGTDLNQKACTDFDNFGSGALTCVDCDYVTTSCKVSSCNNDGARQSGEVCDCGGGACTATQLGSKACGDFGGFTGGTLGCSGSCMYDFDGCITCDNDGMAEKGEPCDGADMNGKTCQSLGFLGGVLSCNSCEFVTSQCLGNGLNVSDFDPTCFDTLKNGDETDTDCGGSCPDCGIGRQCDVGSDCQSGICENGVCVGEDACSNGRMDAGETDIDCGGVCIYRTPPKYCPGGDDCDQDDDCGPNNRCIDNACVVCGAEDLDCDGIPNNLDPDIDGDGIPNHLDPDDDDDGLCDTANSPLNDESCEGNDDDDDNDGVKDPDDKDTLEEWCYDESTGRVTPGACGEDDQGETVIDGDLDNDGIPNFLDPDIDGDGLENWNDPDDDNDGLCDTIDSPLNDESCQGEDDDDDNDGILDDDEIDWDNDLDNNGENNEDDDDQDGDGIPNDEDPDNDNDGIPNDKDPDDDNDGIPDKLEDTDGDGIPDYYEDLYPFLNPRDPSDAVLDYDNDGLTNLEEFERDTLPDEKDTDGDGHDDGKEVEKGTDPKDPLSKPKSSWLLIVLIVLVVFFLGGAGYYLYREYDEYGSFDHLKKQANDLWAETKVKAYELAKQAKIIELLGRIGVTVPEPRRPVQERPQFQPFGQPMQPRPQRPGFPQRPPLTRMPVQQKPAITPGAARERAQRGAQRVSLIDRFNKPAAPKPPDNLAEKEKELAKYVDLSTLEKKEAELIRTIPFNEIKEKLGGKDRAQIKDLVKDLQKDVSEGRIVSRGGEGEEWKTLDELKEGPFIMLGEPKVHEVFERITNLKEKDIDTKPFEDTISKLEDITGTTMTQRPRKHLEHIITSPKVEKEKVALLMSHLSKGDAMTSHDHARILTGLVRKKKLNKSEAFDVLLDLKKKKAVTEKDHDDIFQKLKQFKNTKKL